MFGSYVTNKEEPNDVDVLLVMRCQRRVERRSERMINIRFDHFYRYEALSQLLKQYVEDYPHLVQLESIGSSHEGRAIWVVIVTHFATGPAEEKPAANAHSAPSGFTRGQI
jgi:hypothetical protein